MRMVDRAQQRDLGVQFVPAMGPFAEIENSFFPQDIERRIVIHLPVRSGADLHELLANAAMRPFALSE